MERGRNPTKNCLLNNIDELQLRSLDLQLRLQQEDEFSELTEESGCSGAESDGSVSVITETPRDFKQIRGIFSPKQVVNSKTVEIRNEDYHQHDQGGKRQCARHG